MMDTAYWISLHKILHFHAKKYLKLKEYFQSPKDIWQASKNQLKQFGFSDRAIDEILESRKFIEPNRELDRVIKQNVKTVFFDDPVYPKNLTNIYDPPAILYVKGNLDLSNDRSIAIVGARNASPYGALMAEKLAGDLTQHDICVVSGMARGIDTAAHKGALKKEGRTIAVLGCGVDVVYPRENKNIMEQIVANGAVVSEYPLGTQPLPVYFPIRNRIISGMSLGTVVVEAAERSGSLITADQALEQGREVFAVPGNITDKLSKGPHKLIKQGAKITEDVYDILEEFGWVLDKVRVQEVDKPVQLNLEENIIYSNLSIEPQHLERLIDVCGMPSSKVSSLLLFMELKGLIRKLPGQYYVVNSI